MPIRQPKSLPTLRPSVVRVGTASKAQLKIAGSFAGTGAAYAPLSSRITQTTRIIPSKNFSYATPGGGTESFYAREPKEVSAAMFARLTAQNGSPAKAVQTVTVGDTPAVGDSFTIAVAGNYATYVAVTGDTVIATLAANIVALLNSYEPPLIVASSSGGTITLTATYNGSFQNTYTIMVSKVSATGSIVAGGPHMNGGVDGKFFN